MIELPPKIKSKFNELKKQNKKYVEIKRNKKYYFVYEATSRWDKEKKKVIKVPKYLGRITEEGRFIPSKPREHKALETTSPLAIEVQKSETPSEIAEIQISTLSKPNKYEITLLTALSMNGRMPITLLSKMIGLKETGALTQIRKLEKKYEIKYVPEIDVEKLGYLQFLITVKFIDKFPRIKELKSVLLSEPRVQLALLTKGEYDLMIYVLAKDSQELSRTIIKIRDSLDYQSVWNASPLYGAYGFLLLRDEFIDLLKEKLLAREYSLLKELNRNGNIDFTEVDKKYNFDRGRSQYSFHKLKEAGILKRITISITKLPIKYIGIIFKIIIDKSKFEYNRKKSLLDILENTNTQIDKYLFIGDTFTPDGSVLYLPVFNYDDLDKEIEKLSDFDLGIKLNSLTITNILSGDFCYRKFDNSYSIQQEILEREYSEPKINKINYEETGRKKKNIYHTDIRGALQKN